MASTAEGTNTATLVREQRAAQRASAAAEKKAKAKRPAKAKAKKVKAPPSAESVAARRASDLRENGRRVGPVQVQRMLVALGNPRTKDEVVEASGATSMKHLMAMATGKDKDLKPLRPVFAKVEDAYLAGRWGACVIAAIAEMRS